MIVFAKVETSNFSARIFSYGDHAIDRMIERNIYREVIKRMIERSFDILDEECEMEGGEFMIRSLK